MAESRADGPNAGQTAFWNSVTGEGWVEYRQRLGASTAPLTGLLIRRAAPRAGEAVLDVGCGTDATARALALRGQGRALIPLCSRRGSKPWLSWSSIAGRLGGRAEAFAGARPANALGISRR